MFNEAGPVAPAPPCSHPPVAFAGVASDMLFTDTSPGASRGDCEGPADSFELLPGPPSGTVGFSTAGFGGPGAGPPGGPTGRPTFGAGGAANGRMSSLDFRELIRWMVSKDSVRSSLASGTGSNGLATGLSSFSGVGGITGAPGTPGGAPGGAPSGAFGAFGGGTLGAGGGAGGAIFKGVELSEGSGVGLKD